MNTELFINSFLSKVCNAINSTDFRLYVLSARNEAIWMDFQTLSIIKDNYV